MRIDLDQFLYGKATEEEIKDFWKNGDFCEEKYLVEAIKKYLRDDDDKKAMYDLDMSIEEMLNGIGPWDETQALFNKWNNKIGFRYFSY